MHKKTIRLYLEGNSEKHSQNYTELNEYKSTGSTFFENGNLRLIYNPFISGLHGCVSEIQVYNTSAFYLNNQVCYGNTAYIPNKCTISFKMLHKTNKHNFDLRKANEYKNNSSGATRLQIFECLGSGVSE